MTLLEKFVWVVPDKRPLNGCCCYWRSIFATHISGWLDSRVVSLLDSGTEGPRFESQPRCCWVIVLGKLFIPFVPLFTKKRNW